MNWKHQTIITPIALAEPARAACMARLGLSLAPPQAPDEVEAIQW